MHESTTIERSISAPSDLWRDDNSRGLSLAASGSWSEASHAFSSAADALAARTDVAAHNALALILNNLAQSCFHDGRTDDAIRYAQRACSLRVALVGEDAIAVARARSELAVMLGSANRATEGLSLIARAISAIERSGGDEDIRLLTVLENAARLALAAGQPSSAEPYLLRLHALLDANGMATDTVESLLARVVSFRFEQQIMAMESLVSPDNDVEMIEPEVEAVDSEPSVELPMLVIDAFGDTDDEPLRDAVAITDVLLRTTPSGNRAIVADVEVINEEVDAPTEVPYANILGERVLDESVLDESVLDVGVSGGAGDIFGGAMFELVDLQDSQVTSIDRIGAHVATDNPAMASASMLVELDLLVDDDIDSPLELVPVQQAQHTPIPLNDGGLGFTVEYGAISTAMSYEDMMEPMVVERSSPVVDQVLEVPPTPSAPVPMPAQRTTPRGTMLVMPTPASSHAGIGNAKQGGPQDAPPRLSLQNTDDIAQNRQPKKPVLRAGRASTPRSSSGMLIAGGVAAAIVAAAGWFFMMGR